MKIKIFAAGLVSVLALGAMSSSVFAENITPSGSENESTGSSEVEHIISESYQINIPSKINLNSGSEPNFTGSANVSASNVRLSAGSSLTVSVKTNNGALKIVSDAITSTIPYTISINNQTAINASDMVSTYTDIFTMDAGETEHSAVPLSFTTTSFNEVILAGEHKDTLTFKVNVASAPTPKFAMLSSTPTFDDTISSEADKLSFRSEAAYDTFDHVEMDGETVDPSNYTAESGSTVVTFNSVYALGLETGSHTVKIVTKDNEYAEANFEKTGSKRDIISFTIGGQPYTAVANMTWAEWVLSYGMSSNANGIVWLGFETMPHVYLDNGEQCNNVYYNNVDQKADDIIHDGYAYGVGGPS